jgi:outer membrane protein OmpA-like peptidoglycan-associated protein
MRRSLDASLLKSGLAAAAVILVLGVPPVAAQMEHDGEVRTWEMNIGGTQWEVHPATPAYEGMTGLFHLPTAYSLPRGRLSVSAFRDNLDRDPKDVDISIYGVSLGYGITPEIEIHGNFGIQTGINADALYMAGRVNEYPFVNRPWSEGTGDARVGLKIKFLDDYQLDPVALAIRGFVKIPTADETEGLGTGKPSFGGDLLLSKNLGGVVDLHGMLGYEMNMDPEEPVDVDLADAIRWGVGINVPACSWIQLQAEAVGRQYTGGDDSEIAGATNDPDLGNIVQVGFDPLEDVFGTGPLTNPIDIVIGPVISIRPGIFIRPAVSWNLNFDDRGLEDQNSMGGHLSIGFHPGFGCRELTPPAANMAPTVTCASDRAELLPGETVGIRATATDPEGDPLTYEWSSSSGRVTGTGSTATLDFGGVTAPSSADVTVRVTDNHGNTATCISTVRLAEAARQAEAVSCVAGGFPRNLSRLTNVDKACLDDVAQRLNADPRAGVTVVGHADADETSPDEVSQARAAAVRDYLVQERGIEAARITVVSRMDSRPLDTGTDALAHARNRRVEVWFVPEGATVPE